MSVAGTVDISLDAMGGLVLDMAPSDLPDGVSPDCQDVAFKPGAVFTRPGIGPGLFPVIVGNPTLNYLKTYAQPNLTEVLLALDSLGSLWQAQTAALAQINLGSGQEIVPGARGKSTTLFGREYLALGDGKFGIDFPRWYDGTNLDRLAPSGPGASPQAGDGGAAFVAITSITQPAGTAAGLVWESNFASGIAAVTIALGVDLVGLGLVPGAMFTSAGVLNAGYDAVSNVVQGSGTVGTQFLTYTPTPSLADSSGGTLQSQLATAVTAAPHGLSAGQAITIANNGVAGYNGAVTVLTVIDAYTFTFNVATAGNGVGAGGTLAVAGVVSASLHQLSVIFVFRDGSFSKPAPPNKWIAAGTQTVYVTQIPTGPPNVVARILLFTPAITAPATTGPFFYFDGPVEQYPTMRIPDNVTTTGTFNFSDAALQAASSATDLFNQVELGEVSGFIGYASRLFAWGERNKVENFYGLSFDGGFRGNTPLGWAADGGAAGTGGSQETNTVVWGNAYRVTGDGVSQFRGLITQPAYQDWEGVTILASATAYSVRVRLAKGVGITQGNATIDVFSPSLGVLGFFSVPVANIGVTFQEFTGPLIMAQATIPADAVLRYLLTGTPDNGGFIIADNIEPFPTNEPYNATFARASAIDDAGSFDGVKGLLQPEGGGPIRAAFVLTDRSQLIANDHLYFVKPDAIHRTQDNGGDPATWDVSQVSATIGTPSVDGVDVGEDWAVVAHESGLYLFAFGEEPNKISQEIQPLWDRINWTGAGHTVWVRVDVASKRILIGAPIDGALAPNIVLALDYRGLISASQIIATPPVHFSAYSGKILSLGLGRKWSPWTIAANCAHFEGPDPSLQVGLGGMYFGGQNGKIYNLQDAQLNDDGIAIPSYYQTYYFPSQIQEPMLKLRTHRKLFSYLTGFIEGSGPLSLSAFLGSNQFANPLPSLNLINAQAPAPITGLARTSGMLTVTCAGGHGLTAGTDVAVLIQGSNDETVNGILPIFKIVNQNAFSVFQMDLPDAHPAQLGTAARILRDFEMTTNLIGERCSYRFATTQLNSWFRLQKLSPSLQNDLWSPVRGGM